MADATKQVHEGERVPDVGLRVIANGQVQETGSRALFAGRRVIAFALPGAFTPTCSAQHLPRYEELAPAFREHGVEAIYCLAVNDPFVMAEWGRDQAVHEVELLADGNAEFTAAMGMLIDGRSKGLGRRSRRYSMLVRDGLIEKMFVESDDGDDPFRVSDADTLLQYLAPDTAPAPHVAILTKPGCPFCARAKERLSAHGLRYTELALPDALRARALAAIAGATTAPQVFIDGRLIGDGEALAAYLKRNRRSSVPAAESEPA